jgi:hypothetical protein
MIAPRQKEVRCISCCSTCPGTIGTIFSRQAATASQHVAIPELDRNVPVAVEIGRRASIASGY